MPRKDKEAQRLYMREYRQRNPGKANQHARNTYARYADEYAAKKREWRAEFPELSRDSNKKNYESHREARREAMREYARQHHEQFLDYSSNRRASLRRVKVEDVDRQVVFNRDGGICHICQSTVDPDNWHLDHLIPISKNGKHEYNNVAVSHPECNLRKGDSILPQFAEVVDSDLQLNIAGATTATELMSQWP
jgi:5-methylcytosine-specific restriction endonuclease McrA